MGSSPVTGKRLLFVTGTRADFGKLEPLAAAAAAAGFAISFFITFFVLGGFWFSGSMADQMSGTFASVLHYVSFQSRMSRFMRGLIDTRDVVFFLSITALSLMISFRALERRKWA